MDPKSKWIVMDRNIDAHRHNAGINSEWQHDGRKNSEHFHGHIQFIGEQGIVSGFQRFNGFFGAFQIIPNAGYWCR